MTRLNKVEERIWRSGRMLHEATYEEALEVLQVIAMEIAAGIMYEYQGKALFAIRFALATEKEKSMGYIQV